MATQLPISNFAFMKLYCTILLVFMQVDDERTTLAI